MTHGKLQGEIGAVLPGSPAAEIAELLNHEEVSRVTIERQQGSVTTTRTIEVSDVGSPARVAPLPGSEQLSPRSGCMLYPGVVVSIRDEVSVGEGASERTIELSMPEGVET